jgi:adenylate cyclase
LSTKKAGALLAYLALHPGQAQARPKLATLLWGDHSEVQARDSLRQALSLLRKALSGIDPGALTAHEDTINFQPTALTTDAIVFGDLAAQAGAEHLEQAIALYRGELLDGFQVRAPEFESWVTAERERFREMALQAMTKLLDHHLSAGPVERGIHMAARLLAADPLQERVHRTLMELYCRQGRHGAALRQYRTCADLLAKELGIEPDATTKALRREILRGWNQQQGTTLTSNRDATGWPSAPLPLAEPSFPPSLPLPDKPSIAVMPFANLSGDPEQDYFADGMVEEIITALSRIRWLFVIARNSSFTYKGRAVDVKEVGRELGVRYVLEGSVRKAGGRVRITGQLIDAAADAHLWVDRFDGSLDDIFELQDKVASSVAGVIEPALQAAEIRRSSERPTSDLTAYDLYLRALAPLRLGEWEKERYLQSLDLAANAIKLDPHYGSALALAAFCHMSLHGTGWTDDADADRREGIDLAHRALAVAGNDPGVLGLVARVLGYFGEDIAAAIALIDRALELNPSFALAWQWSAWLRLWAGEPDVGIRHMEISMRFNPLQDRAGPHIAIGMGHFFSRRFEDAAATLTLALQERPSWVPTYRFLASCYAHLGRLDEAREIARRLRMLTADVVPIATHWRNAEHRELYLSGLRLAVGE